MIIVATMVKDEHLDIREWVEHNLSLGFDRILLYDNNSSHGYEPELGDLIDRKYIEIRDWGRTDPHRQRDMYNHVTFERTWDDDDWVAFIDPDEFIRLDEPPTIQDLVGEYRFTGAVTLSWMCYGADGRIERPDLPVSQAYMQAAPKVRENHNFKTICRPNMVSYWADVHRPVMQGDHGFVVNTKHEPVYNSLVKEEYQFARIDHYITKSWADYVRRLERGNVTRGIRKVETFFAYNPDMADRRDELVRDLDVSRFPTIQSDREVARMVKDLFASDLFVRLAEAAQPEVPDHLFQTVCVMELCNFAALRIEQLAAKDPRRVKAIHAMVDKQIEHLNSLPEDLPDYRKTVVETIISTPFEA